MSCREPEEVSYGSEEQRGSSLTKRLQIPLIITLSVKGEQTVTLPPSLSLSPSSPCLSMADTVGLCQTSVDGGSKLSVGRRQ